MRLHCHDANTMFEFHFDLEHAAKIVDGDQRPVAQAAKAFLGNAQFDLGTIAGIPDVVIIEIIVVIPINVMPIVVIAVIVIAIFRPVVTAATVIITATIVAVIVIGEGCRRERMRRTTCDYRQANGR